MGRRRVITPEQKEMILELTADLKLPEQLPVESALCLMFVMANKFNGQLNKSDYYVLGRTVMGATNAYYDVYRITAFGLGYGDSVKDVNTIFIPGNYRHWGDLKKSFSVWRRDYFNRIPQKLRKQGRKQKDETYELPVCRFNDDAVEQLFQSNVALKADVSALFDCISDRFLSLRPKDFNEDGEENIFAGYKKLKQEVFELRKIVRILGYEPDFVRKQLATAQHMATQSALFASSAMEILFKLAGGKDEESGPASAVARH